MGWDLFLILRYSGTLPDFGNFPEETNCYDAIEYAIAVSAKAYEFNNQGNETKIDYRRMMRIVLDAGYHGYIGIEAEGEKNIIATNNIIHEAVAIPIPIKVSS